MGLFKEETFVIDFFGKRQGQIYDDACDYGVRLTSEERDQLRRAVQSLRSTVPTKPVHRAVHGPYAYSKTEIFVPWEVEDGMAHGTYYTIEFHDDREGGFFTIDARRDVCTMGEIDAGLIHDDRD